MTRSQHDIYVPGTRLDLFRRKALFLSASVPYERPGLTAPEAIQRNQRYVRDARPANIRDAISYLCRFAFQRDLNLIFGAHPAIVPIVLTAARRFSPTPNQKHVIVFQSAFFEAHQIPRLTLDLADWSCGELLLTERSWVNGSPDRAGSLTRMREEMVRSPNLIGAVFMGGMEGVEEECELFGLHQPQLPRYALGSTGSAAAELLDRDPTHLCGTGQRLTTHDLAHDPSYPRVFRRLFEDLGLP
jgi:hypothetical protein